MKKTNILNKLAVAMMAVLALSSCNNYLDKLPDDRADVNTQDKVSKLLVSAYPTVSMNTILEISSDNVADNGSSFGTIPMLSELYNWKDVTSDSNDSPRMVWNGFYGSVATCNEALASIAKMENGANYTAQIAEAKMIRAYSMFMLSSAFCMAWDPAKADEYLGLPYPTEPEKNVNTMYERGSLRLLYENINKDIEEALPYIDDVAYISPKYHFNKKAAYAFAARFNLYYQNFDKAIEYANVVLGDNPKALMRDYTKYKSLGRDDFGTQWIRSSESANLLLLPAYSVAWRYLCVPQYPRFMHNGIVCSYETFYAKGPWGDGTDANTLYWANKIYGSNQAACMPKMEEQFEVTDKVNFTGYPHIVDAVFTGDETLLVRAEAYAINHQFDKAIADINTWIETHCEAEKKKNDVITVRPVMTEESINEFINAIEYTPIELESNYARTIRKHLNPQGFTLDPGAGYDASTEQTLGSTQENIIQLILHMRRLETMFQGMRFYDIKRYGIAFGHNMYGRESLKFKSCDLRGALQLPPDVINAGLEANPR